MIQISSILNNLAFPARGSSKSRSVFGIAGIITVLCILMCAWMTLVCIPEKFVMMVDEVTLGPVSKVTVGENSDVNIGDVPYQYLTIENTGDSCRWTISKEHNDTLQYFKINNDNPNANPVKPDDEIKITLPLTAKRDTTLTVKGQAVYDEWKKFSKQKDVMVRHFIAHYSCRKEGATKQDSLLFMSHLDDANMRSFFDNQGGSIKLIILDPYVTINGEGYKHSGSVKGNMCKVQFFTVTSYCYKDDDDSSDYFQFNGINYVMKPLVRSTKWGAGHIMLKWNDGIAKLHFPKAVGYVGDVDSLRQSAIATSNVVTFRQSDFSFPTNSDIFLPYFSHTIGQDLCNLEFSKDGDQLSVRDNNNNTTVISNPMSMLPQLQKVSLKSGSSVVSCRVGFINNGFMLRYILLPLLVVVLLTIVSLSPWSPLRVNKQTLGSDGYNMNQMRDFPQYVVTLLWIGFAYTICKSMIAMKLSYTYPYFEKLTGITPFNTAMLMLLFFTVMLIINHNIVTYRTAIRHKKKKTVAPYFTWAFLVLLFVGLCLTLFVFADNNISYGIINSYFGSEIGFFPHRWMSPNAYGVLDNHRTVCYALITTEAMMLCILLLLYIRGAKLYAWVDRTWTRLTAWMQSTSLAKKADLLMDQLIAGSFVTKAKPNPIQRKRSMASRVKEFFSDCRSHIPVCTVLIVLAVLMKVAFGSTLMFAAIAGFAVMAFLLDFVHDAFIAALRTLFPGHMILIVLLAVAGMTLGNFGTAFITLAGIMGLSRALTNVRITDPHTEDKAALPRHKVFTEMIIISGAYILGAMMGDNGYMTNYFGFLMAVLCFYFIMERPGEMRLQLSKEQQKERKWVIYTLIFVAVAALFLPSICAKLVNTDKVDYSRMSRRIMLFSSFDDLQSSGFRYAESDSEFMVVMSHYMQLNDGQDPLSNDHHFLHSSVSTGQSPVVLNDLSMPIAFFGSYGTIMTTFVYFALMFCLLYVVLRYTFAYNSNKSLLTRAMQWRLLAVFMWVGTSFYIYMSYLGRLPFTGRLNPGFGVDAVGEALETAFLLAFMASVTLTRSKK